MKKTDELNSLVEKFDVKKTKSSVEKMFKGLKELCIDEKVTNFLCDHYDKFIDNMKFLFKEAENQNLTKEQFGRILFMLFTQIVYEDTPVYYAIVQSAVLDSYSDKKIEEYSKKELEEIKKEDSDLKEYAGLLTNCKGGYKN